MGFDDKRIMDCPRLGNIYVYPVEGNQKEIMILESVWFYIIILILGFVWIYLTE